MSADNKTNFVNKLKGKHRHIDECFSLDIMIKEQDVFMKTVRDYASSAWVVELIKVSNIIHNEICNRAEFGDMIEEIRECNTSTPKKCDSCLVEMPLCEPLQLKKP